MRSAYCREHIDKTVVECGLSDNTLYQVKQAAEFEVAHPEFDFSNCGTESILAVKRIKDPEVQNRTIEEMIRRRNQVDKNGNRTHSEKFTEKEIRDIINGEIKKKAERLEREKFLQAEEARALKEEAAPEAIALPAIHMKAVDVIEIKEIKECAADEVRINPILPLDEKHIEPTNSLTSSLGMQVVGTEFLPDMKSEAPLGNDVNGMKVLIATCNDCIQSMLKNDRDLLKERQDYKDQIEALEDVLDPLEKEFDELAKKIESIRNKIINKRAAIKRVDLDRKKIGENINTQHTRIFKLTEDLKKMEG